MFILNVKISPPFFFQFDGIISQKNKLRINRGIKVFAILVGVMSLSLQIALYFFTAPLFIDCTEITLERARIAYMFMFWEFIFAFVIFSTSITINLCSLWSIYKTIGK